MLFETFMQKCYIMEKVRTPDGEGGYTVNWEEGIQIDAAIVLDSSVEARAAEQAGMTSVYTITTPPTAILEYHDVIKREQDGKIFRVTSDGNDLHTPEVATFEFRQVTAESWELT